MTTVFGKEDRCLWKIWRESLKKITVILIKQEALFFRLKLAS